MDETQQKNSVESTLKSLDTEEFIDIYFYRPIGFCWALLFKKIHVSPNWVTIAGIIIGAAAGICFYFPNLKINLLGMLLLVWANSYDSADGQLARMTGKQTSIGRMLDGLCGVIWFVVIYFAICFRLFPLWGFWIWILAITTGFFHSRQAAMADYYRNIHLFFLKGKAGSELADSALLKEGYMKMSWKHGFIEKFFNAYYINYTKNQESQSPNFQRFIQIVRAKYPENVPDRLRAAFREKSLPLMKYTNMLSFNTRVIALFVALLVNRPWLYFIFELTVLNAMFVYMVVRHERICKGFHEQLMTE